MEDGQFPNEKLPMQKKDENKMNVPSVNSFE